jgi:DNA-binding transcriptional ArsR family regulator
MVNYSAELDATFSALADPTRRAILARLAHADIPVGELAKPFAMTLPAISKHLSVLERAGLLVREKEGRIRRCRVLPGSLSSAADWIAHYGRFWQERLDALDRYLVKDSKKEEEPWKPRNRRRPAPPPPAPRSRSRARSRRRGKTSSALGPTRKPS